LLKISPVIETLKKLQQLEQVNKTLRKQSEPQIGDVMVVRPLEAEMHEMWSFVWLQHQRWLYAIDQNRQISVRAGNA